MIPCSQSSQKWQLHPNYSVRAAQGMPAPTADCRMLSWSRLLHEWGGWKRKRGGFDLQVKLPGSTPRNDGGGGLKVKLHLGGGGWRGPASDAEARQLGTAAKV